MTESNESIRETTDLTLWAIFRPCAHLLILSIPLIAVNRSAGLVWPFLSKYLIDDVIVRRSQSMLLVIIGIVTLATIAQGISGYMITRIVSPTSQRLLVDLRKRVHHHVSLLPLAYFDSNKTGTLVSRIMSDVDGIGGVLGSGLVTLPSAIAMACIALIALVLINPMLTLVIFLVLAAFGIFFWNATKGTRSLYGEASRLRADVTGRLTESLGGVRVVKAYRAELREHETFKLGVDRMLQNSIRIINTVAILDLAIVVLTGMFGATVIYFGGNALMAGTMSVGDFFQYFLFLGMLVSPVLQIVALGRPFNQAFASLERVRELLANQREDQDLTRSVHLSRVKGEVSFESVSFAYGDNAEVLHNISFRANPGRITALVGPSGAGKSTIINLIAGFYKVKNGTVRVDGVDLSCIDLASYRTQLGMVPQDTFLFSGTIRDNVAFSRPGATTDEIIRACRLAHIDEFAETLDAAYETVVGERGIRLSVGQRQRIAIARAILANPRILILDEATSSLDSISEVAIQKALSVLLRDRTTFVIAHRLSTIRQADQILVIDGGYIVERGTHESLLRAKGKYYQLYTSQYELQSNLFLAPGEGRASIG